MAGQEGVEIPKPPQTRNRCLICDVRKAGLIGWIQHAPGQGNASDLKQKARSMQYQRLEEVVWAGGEKIAA